MHAVVLLLGAVALGAEPAARPHHESNSIYRALVDEGLKLPSGALHKFPQPLLADGLDAAGQRAALESIADAFVPRLIEATRSLKIAPAEDPSCFVPPVIDGEAQARIVRLIEQGKKEAKLLFAAELGALADEGFFVPPTIFGDVPPSAVIAQEEIFGPVLAVLRVRNLDEALEVANGTSYALTGGLFSRSPAHIAEVRRRFRVGNLYINRKITGALVDRQPFGGFKLSGIGSKAGGPDYLQQFLLPRAICENTMRHGFVPSPPSIH